MKTFTPHLKRGLKEKLGEVGGAIRRGDRENDQVATDFKLFLLDHMLNIASLICDLNAVLLEKASEYGGCSCARIHASSTCATNFLWARIGKAFCGTK